MSTSSSMNNGRARGAAMVEMAIILTLLVILVIGITELGRALFFQHKLTKAVESGARYLGRSWDAVDVVDCSEGVGWDLAVVSAANLAVYGTVAGTGTPAIPNFDPADVTATVESRDVTGIDDPICVVNVSVAVEYAGLFFGGGGFLPPIILGGSPGGTWTLTASSEERYVGD